VADSWSTAATCVPARQQSGGCTSLWACMAPEEPLFTSPNVAATAGRDE
jgi:hypothetical protein